MRHRGLSLLALSLACLLTLACAGGKAPDAPPRAEGTPASQAKPVEIPAAYTAAFQPIPAQFDSADNAVTDEKVALGKLLFVDPRFSKSGTISCNSCHHLDGFGVDSRPTSEGHDKQLGKRNAPTVFNAAGHVAQFWDGRAATVEEQALGPIMNPIEMAMPSEDDVVKAMKAVPAYVDAFAKAFPGEKDPVTFQNFGRAIGAFERRLATPSRFDEMLAGNHAALTEEEKRGLKTFVDSGCIACHSGALVGGGMHQKLGLAKPWPDSADLGRFELTKQESDRQVFKVPSLRLIEKTGPYFHDGKVATLEDAVRLMGEHQLGKQLSPEDVASIVTFLKALTSTPPPELTAPPTMS